MLADLLAHDGVVEELALRSRVAGEDAPAGGRVGGKRWGGFKRPYA